MFSNDVIVVLLRLSVVKLKQAFLSYMGVCCCKAHEALQEDIHDSVYGTRSTVTNVDANSCYTDGLVLEALQAVRKLAGK